MGTSINKAPVKERKNAAPIRNMTKAERKTDPLTSTPTLDIQWLMTLVSPPSVTFASWKVDLASSSSQLTNSPLWA